MTFSIVGFCQQSGMTGVAISSSSICVASRCPWVRAGVGAVATQNITDPRLGKQMLDLMERGMSAAEAINEVGRRSSHIEFRQLTAVDGSGSVAHFSGDHILGIHAVAEGRHCLAAGNLLACESVPRAMVDSFESGNGRHLADRLLAAMQAAIRAGGEAGPVHSAGIKIAHRQAWPYVDLRVDWSERDPIDALVRLWRSYEPQMDDYVTRAIDPSAAPSYGVPGDQ